METLIRLNCRLLGKSKDCEEESNALGWIGYKLPASDRGKSICIQRCDNQDWNTY